MELSTYCFNEKMSFEQYEKIEKRIKTIANSVLSYIKLKYKIDTGVYFSIGELPMPNDEWQPFIIKELKVLGVEFFDNNTLWRF